MACKKIRDASIPLIVCILLIHISASFILPADGKQYQVDGAIYSAICELGGNAYIVTCSVNSTECGSFNFLEGDKIVCGRHLVSYNSYVANQIYVAVDSNPYAGNGVCETSP